MTEFRARFLGKVSPVHFFWGSFDLATTRFSGRNRRRRPPASPQRRQLGHGGSLFARGLELRLLARQRRLWPRPAFYVYAYPEPQGYGDTRLSMADGFYDKNVGQFILPYDCVREARDLDALLLGFLQETYAAAADLAKWNRAALKRKT